MVSFLLVQLGVVQGLMQPFVHDCQELKDYGYNGSGIFHVVPVGTCKGFNAYCDMTTDDGGWLVFQRREDGSVDFYRDWDDYQFGFGTPTGEHWLGNLALHLITRQGHYELRIDLTDYEGNSRFAKYSFFQLKDSSDRYTLRVSGYHGNAGDALYYHNGKAFSTFDNDNDGNNATSCAEKFNGAWWYDSCHRSNLNGLYLEGNHTSYADGVNWMHWRGHYYSLKTAEMKIRRNVHS